MLLFEISFIGKIKVEKKNAFAGVKTVATRLLAFSIKLLVRPSPLYEVQWFLENSPNSVSEIKESKKAQMKDLYEDVEEGFRRLHNMAIKAKGLMQFMSFKCIIFKKFCFDYIRVIFFLVSTWI